MPNRLATETSPYLLQHAHNPVDWYPWGEEAFARARAEDRPVLLSVGYSACHWCHVMEHESFENPEIAGLMNQHFVNIKVDREERPDVDAVYMQAVQAISGHGGWPMTVFLTPDARPFHAGTYFPPEDRGGMPGLPRVLLAVAEAYRQRKDEVIASAGRLTEHIAGSALTAAGAGALTPAIMDEAARRLVAAFDTANGGFGGPPKFPQAMALDFLLRHHARTRDAHSLDMVTRTLRNMAAGGIRDQLGGGFHRYAVDAIWLVPHFEKMLYDNALLARVYLHAWQVTGEPSLRSVAEGTIDYVLRDMANPAGGFYSSEDADSDGVEGRFYTWTREELVEALGSEDGALAALAFGVGARPNFEHTNVLHRPLSLSELAAAAGLPEDALVQQVDGLRARLLEARARRARPARDEKVLTAWNGLMLRALAEAAAVLEREDYARAAVANASFLLDAVRDGDRVLRSWKDGRARIAGYLEDYALLADGLLAVYELTFEPRWLAQARAIATAMAARFWDAADGCFYDTPVDGERLIVRPRDPLDNATPSGSSAATLLLARLAALDGDPEKSRLVERVLAGYREALARFPSGFGELLAALDTYVSPGPEVAIIGDPDAEDTRALRRVLYRRFRPNRAVAGRRPGDGIAARLSPLLEGRGRRDGRATAYVCHRFACQAPTTDPAELERQLDGRS